MGETDTERLSDFLKVTLKIRGKAGLQGPRPVPSTPYPAISLYFHDPFKIQKWNHRFKMSIP